MPKKRPGNQHNNRHENGIVAPGKRITKQRSNGHIIGGVAGDLSSPSPPDPSASAAHATALSPGKQPSRQSTAVKTVPPVAQEKTNEIDTAGNGDVEAPVASRQANGSVVTPMSKTVKIASIDAGKRRDSAFSLPLTIIRSCPLADTLTILIILLSIPSTILTLINTLFASLTFMPPAGAFFSLPSTLGDIFQGSGGTPSLATVLITDFIGLLIWLVSWGPIQALAIEYTQAVVAATLGGSSTNKKTGHDRTILCMAIVTARHLLSRGWVPARIMGYDWRAVLSRIPYIENNRHSFISNSNDDFLMTESRGSWGWFRILVALHILVQGLVHVARRWYQKREYTQSQSISLGKKFDPEAGANQIARPGPTPLPDSPGLNSPNSPSPSTTLKSSLPIVKDVREKTSSGKRRRKQAAQVRSQQPLWAAFAATKVTIMREYENGNARHESIQSHAKDATNLGDARFNTENDQIWVSNIQSDRFTFLSTYLNSPLKAESDLEGDSTEDFGSKRPFHVRINDTDWTSTTIAIADTSDEAYLTWSVVVFGLAPSSSYRCSLVSGEDDEVLSTMTVTTSPSPLEENDSSSLILEAPQRAQRPYSPTSPSTTLRKSISGFEANVNEHLARQKRLKKENKNATTNVKKEIEMLHAKINKLAGEDRSHANRHMQWSQHTKQADEALISINAEIERLCVIPEEEINTSRQKRSTWEEAKERERLVQNKIAKVQAEAQREQASIQTDIQSARLKGDRLQARHLKIKDQLEKLKASNSFDAAGKGNKSFQLSQKEFEQSRIEQELEHELQGVQQAWQESRYNIAEYAAQIQQLEASYHEQRLAERPLTPEGDLPGENPHNAPSAAFRIPAFGTPESGGLRSHSGSLRQAEARLRSSSLQSGNSSNYVDFDDQDPAPPPPPPMPFRAAEAIREARKRSGGSNGGSSGSNSQRDPASPIAGVRDSPLGKKHLIWNP